MKIQDILDKRNELSKKIAFVGACMLLSGSRKHAYRQEELLSEYKDLDLKIINGDYE